MNILFLGIDAFLHPWYDDFCNAINGAHPIKLYDPKQPLEPQFKDIDIVVDQGGVHATREMIDLAKKRGIKLWQVIGTGLDHTDVPYFLEKEVLLANTPGQFSAIALAEHALFQMLFIAKNFLEAQQTLKARKMCVPMNDELEGRKLALVGFGASARELAPRAAALGMEVHAMDIVEPDAATLKKLGVRRFVKPDQFHSILEDADFVSLHTPLLNSTRNLIGKAEFDRMKQGASLINVARAEVVNEDALFEALKSKKLRAAALDVFPHEPVDPNHRLLQFSNVIATPHTAGVTTGTSRRRGEAAAENVKRVARGEAPLFQIKSVE